EEAEADAASVGRLRSELAAAHRDADTARAELNRVRAELNSARAEVDRFRHASGIAGNELGALVELVESLQTERDNLAAELDTLREPDGTEEAPTPTGDD
ncbi:MAG: hypothetical protein ACRD0G_09780, partial [Acidimicrobiales bacterium]